MSQDADESIEVIKKFLLHHNPSRVGPENQDEVLNRFTQYAQQLLPFFQRKTTGISDRLGLLATDTFSIWILRTSQVISSKKIDTNDYIQTVQKEILTVHNSTTIFEFVIDFWVNGSPAFINALKDLFTKFLHLIKLIYPLPECDRLLSSWLNKTLQVPSDLPVQYYLIGSLAEELDLFPVLQQKPGFVKNSLSLMKNDLLSNPIGKSLYKILMNVFRGHFGGEISNIPNWLDLWRDPVMTYLNHSRCKKAMELYILQPLFKEMPAEAFTAFVGGITRDQPSILLSILRVGQELGIEEEPFCNDRLISLETINKLLKQDEFKLAAFELLTFSLKKSSPVHSCVFDLMKENMMVFFVDTRIEVRNYFCSSFKHFVYRLRDSAHSLHKSASSMKKANKFPAEQKQKFNYVEGCKLFLEWLLEFLKLQICPGTQYQRNDVALKLLKNVIESGLDSSIPTKYFDMKNARTYPFSIPIFRDNCMVRLLFDCLASNFSDIRQTAKTMLLMALEGSDAPTLKQYIDWGAIKQQTDIFLAEYQYSDIGAALESVRFHASADKLNFVSEMVDALHEKVDNSSRDLVKFIHEPISGYLTSLALILAESPFNEVSEKMMVEKCIEIVSKVWSVVKHVICHESCEDNLSLMYPDGDASAQLVLSTAFRTTKESSTLLRVLLSNYDLSTNQLIDIGDFLINQLFDIRHSGAFQSVTPTFSVLCMRCTKQNEGQLMEWLKDIMKSVQVKTQNITRRSGGIPPMLAVILSAESGRDRPLLKYAFDRLMQIASTPVEKHQDRFDLPQVNAFNCIKAIFTDSKLSQACDPFTYPALSLALRNFDSSSWALRNCSIMLFTSLQNRLFGKSGKSISARMFFTRYSGVRENLLEILHISAPDAPVGYGNQSQVESIFLVLSILLRLKPTPGYKGLDAFKDEVWKCLSSNNWNVREMAAKAISSLADDPSETANEIAKGLNTETQNGLHGGLLALNELLASSEELGSPELSNFLTQVLYDKCDELLSDNKCFTTAKAYLTLMRNVLRLSDSDTSQDERDRLLTCVTLFFNTHCQMYAVDGSKQLCLATALEIILEFSEGEQISTFFERGVLSPFYEVQKVALNFALTRPDRLSTINSSVVDLLQLLVDDESVPASVSAISLKALETMNEKIDMRLLLDVIETPRSEELQLSAIQILGSNTTSDEIGTFEKIICLYSTEDQPVDFRLACLQSLKGFPNLTSNARLLLLLNEMLCDDDEVIREAVAFFLNQTFSLTEVDGATNPVALSRMLLSHIVELFPKEQLSSNITTMLRKFLGDYNYSSFNDDYTSSRVFVTEKNNQFKNEFEHNMLYAKLLQLSGHDDEFEIWLISLKDNITVCLKNSAIKDGPFGWASNGDVFSRLLVLRALLKLVDPRQLESFDQALIKSKIHPFIVSKSILDSIQLSAAKLDKLSVL